MRVTFRRFGFREASIFQAAAPFFFSLFFLCSVNPASAQGLTLYSIGDPTPSEQLYLELINRSRANPPAEGIRLRDIQDPAIRFAYTYFGVDLNEMVRQFNLIAAVPPLAMNARLLTAARNHSSYQVSVRQQTHTGPGGSDAGIRMTASGYVWSAWGENVYAFSQSVQEGHAAFNVDWGFGPSGMQSPPGHRQNIHSANFREVGIGVVASSNTEVGPQVVTQDFGRQLVHTPFITGVVYRDANGNNFYDPGEGIGGVTVNVAGSIYYAVTASAGGYAIPVTTNGTYQVTFSGSGLPTVQRSAVVVSQRNVKVDYLPSGNPPRIRISSIRRNGGLVELIVTVESGSVPSIRLQRASTVTGTYQIDTGATVESLGANQFRIRANPSGSARWFYRVTLP